MQPAELQSLDRRQEFIGRVKAMEKVELRARVEGFLGPRAFNEGDNVKQGQVLFTIDRAPFEATLAQRQAQLAGAKANLEFAKQQLQRARELSQQNSSAISKAQIDERIADEAKAQAAVMDAEAAVTEATINLSYTEIKSPIDGRVGLAAVSPGNLVSPATGVLTAVVAENPVQILFPVTQRELLEYRKTGGADRKLTVQVMLADGSIYDEIGRIDFLDVQVNPNTDGQTVRALLPNKDMALTDGQTVRVLIEQQAPAKAVTVPKAAVAIDKSGPYVFVVNEKNMVEQRRIKLGKQKGSLVAIDDGLAANELVIVEGQQKVRPGMEVTAQLSTSPASSQQGAGQP
ncbi:MAG: efflux RND transporter periplasmic adaptor subunit [Hyphomicrobium sp.]|nr:efflux RND transporter periplasmic adaptor subunit [Hyphomicrobium sp.]